VLAKGETDMLPERGTTPTPLSILTDVAFDTLQLKIAESPAYMVDGLAVR
jgi:hypothetical protein